MDLLNVARLFHILKKQAVGITAMSLCFGSLWPAYALAAEPVAVPQVQIQESQHIRVTSPDGTATITTADDGHSPTYPTLGNQPYSPSQIQSDPDPLSQLIKSRQNQYKSPTLQIEQQTRVQVQPSWTQQLSPNTLAEPSFDQWLSESSYRRNEVANYRAFLQQQLGHNATPPMSQLLTTARNWQSCGYEKYEVPPKELWNNILPTLRLYHALKTQGVIPQTAEIRSVYRNPGLNACVGGADESKHIMNAAMDIWVPEYDNIPWQINMMQESLCQFWSRQGAFHDFGLGVYGSGAIHLDTQGYRKWGAQHTPSYSACRY